MAIYTASDFCQGHGGGRECTYDPDFGYCQHGDDFDHGTVSYCDGTCTESREHYNRYLRTELHQVPPASETVIWLEVWGNGVSYEVAFEGPQAEDRALAYMSTRKALHFSEVYDRPFNGYRFERLDDLLHPQCHHGMSLQGCMDPYGDGHFGTREQELAGGW